MTPRVIKKLVEQGVTEILVPADDLIGRYLAGDVIDESNGEVFFEAGDEVTQGRARPVRREGLRHPDGAGDRPRQCRPLCPSTLAIDRKRQPRRRADRHLPGDAPGRAAELESAEALFNGLFFDQERYDLSAVGRVKMNARWASRPTTSCAFCARTTSCRSSGSWSTSRTAAARSTTSTTSATAASVRSAS